jgi:4-amino-4-deoxy-L-arabinose transferase-like glycosyltransferase
VGVEELPTAVANAMTKATHRAAGIVRDHRGAVSLVVTGFGLRIVWMLYARPEPVSDYQVYVALAENLLDDGFFGLDASSALWLPGYPAFLSVVMLISREVLWLSFVNVVLSTLACVLVYMVAREVANGDGIPVVAAGVCALTPGLVLYAPVLGTEQLFIVLFLVAVLLTMRIRGTSPWIGIGAGVVAGLAALTRGEMLFYLPVLLAFIWFTAGIDSISHRMRQCALLLAGVAIVLVPWAVRNAVVVDAGLSLSTVGGMNFYFGHRADGYGFTTEVPWPLGDDIAANRIGWKEGLAYVGGRPIALLESARDGTYAWLESPEYALIWSTGTPDEYEFLVWDHRYIRFEGVTRRLLIISSAISLSLGAAAFIAWRRWSVDLRILAAGVVSLNWLGHAVLFFGHPRFRYTVDTIATILVAITIVTLWNGSGNGRRIRASASYGDSHGSDAGVDG